MTGSPMPRWQRRHGRLLTPATRHALKCLAILVGGLGFIAWALNGGGPQ